jgi:hypothetical protein
MCAKKLYKYRYIIKKRISLASNFRYLVLRPKWARAERTAKRVDRVAHGRHAEGPYPGGRAQAVDGTPESRIQDGELVSVLHYHLIIIHNHHVLRK